MLKDMILVEAALATDRTITSLDEEVRKLLATASATIRTLKSVVWVNPIIASEGAILWLKAGAKPDKHRRLGLLSKPS